MAERSGSVSPADLSEAAAHFFPALEVLEGPEAQPLLGALLDPPGHGPAAAAAVAAAAALPDGLPERELQQLGSGMDFSSLEEEGLDFASFLWPPEAELPGLPALEQLAGGDSASCGYGAACAAAAPAPLVTPRFAPAVGGLGMDAEPSQALLLGERSPFSSVGSAELPPPPPPSSGALLELPSLQELDALAGELAAMDQEGGAPAETCRDSLASTQWPGCELALPPAAPLPEPAAARAQAPELQPSGGSRGSSLASAASSEAPQSQLDRASPSSPRAGSAAVPPSPLPTPGTPGEEERCRGPSLSIASPESAGFQPGAALVQGQQPPRQQPCPCEQPAAALQTAPQKPPPQQPLQPAPPAMATAGAGGAAPLTSIPVLVTQAGGLQQHTVQFILQPQPFLQPAGLAGPGPAAGQLMVPGCTWVLVPVQQVQL